MSSTKTTSWFTLIEVLVAAVLMGSVFYGIIQLIGSSSSDAVRIEHTREMDSIFLSSKACISSLGIATLSGMTATGSINFGNDLLSCATGSYDTDLAFSGIVLETANLEDDTVVFTGSVTYWSYFKTAPTASGSVQVASYITDGSETKSYDFEVWR